MTWSSARNIGFLLPCYGQMTPSLIFLELPMVQFSQCWLIQVIKSEKDSLQVHVGEQRMSRTVPGKELALSPPRET